MNSKKHPFRVRYRMFKMWQRSGEIPFSVKEKNDNSEKEQHFFTGSFDSIPFLNNEAKRTFVHLLLRPGYMIRDYFYGKREIYLAPFTALIIFYAFFGTLMSVIAPNYLTSTPKLMDSDMVTEEMKSDTTNLRIYTKAVHRFREIYLWTHLDQYPEKVETKLQASVSAVEGTLRFQGVQYFLTRFLGLWLVLWVQFRKKYKVSSSAAATMSAFFLCQFCFIILFESLLVMGPISRIVEDLSVMAILVFNYHQLFDMKWWKALLHSMYTGLLSSILAGIMALVIIIGIAILALI